MRIKPFGDVSGCVLPGKRCIYLSAKYPLAGQRRRVAGGDFLDWIVRLFPCRISKRAVVGLCLEWRCLAIPAVQPRGGRDRWHRGGELAVRP